jgi:hypothetical protein
LLQARKFPEDSTAHIAAGAEVRTFRARALSPGNALLASSTISM